MKKVLSRLPVARNMVKRASRRPGLFEIERSGVFNLEVKLIDPHVFSSLGVIHPYNGGCDGYNEVANFWRKGRNGNRPRGEGLGGTLDFDYCSITFKVIKQVHIYLMADILTREQEKIETWWWRRCCHTCSLVRPAKPTKR